jgi:hypothetical protein
MLLKSQDDTEQEKPKRNDSPKFFRALYYIPENVTQTVTFYPITTTMHYLLGFRT